MGSGGASALGFAGIALQAHAGHERARATLEQSRVEKQLGFLEDVRGVAEANEIRRTLVGDLATATASAAARGLDTGSGSPITTEEEIERVGRLGIARAEQLGRVRAAVRRQRSRFLRRQSRAQDFETVGVALQQSGQVAAGAAAGGGG